MNASATLDELATQECLPCTGGVPALKGTALETLKRKLGQDWSVVDEHHLEKEFTFDDFRQALDFTNRIGEIAEQQNHHPALLTEWGKVTVSWWTHTVRGLHLNDFIMAAKTDDLYKG